MKEYRYFVALVAGLITLSWDMLAAENPEELVITAFTRNENQAVLEWTGGRPYYQVQTSSNIAVNWVNLGSLTTNTFAFVTIGKDINYFRIVSDFTAQYQVVFDATWSQTTLPTNWPSNAHFSGLVGGTHNPKQHFWRDGETASEGIRLMAELGQKTTLLGEISTAMTNGVADFALSGGGISPSPGQVSLLFPQPMRRDFPLVTLVSMIAPSPDWFVGVDSLSLIENGQWVTNKRVKLYGRDAGTDSGLTYTVPDQVTTPRGVITPFTGFPAVFEGAIVPFGSFTFTRLD